MRDGVQEMLLSRLSDMIAVHVGLHFPRERWHDLKRGISSAAKDFGFDNVESCIQWLVSSSLTRNQIEILASNLTIGETYFFRDKRIFEILEEHIIPELISLRRTSERRLRIWSAGCATGEEPYSIAILLKKMIPDLRDWNITLLATDINPRFLQKASKGAYTDWSFRGTPRWVREGYFGKIKTNLYQISSDVKEMVTFSFLNLVRDSYPSLVNNTNAVDIIFCRNVLMYFATGTMHKVIQKLYRSLVDGGWLIVSPCETSNTLASQFTAVNFPGTILYRKVLNPSGIPGKIFRENVLTGEEEQETGISFQIPFEPVDDITDGMTVQRFTVCIDEENKKPEVPEPKDPYMEILDIYRKGLYREAGEKLITFLSDRKVIGNNPAFTREPVDLLIHVYANQGKLHEALEWCEKAITMDKTNPCFHYLRANILQELGHVEESVISLKRVLYLNPDFVLAHFALGMLNRKKGKIREANRHFKNALSILDSFRDDDVLPESEGMTAKRLREIIVSTMEGI
ncbi:MAG: CheR family methyltransferase [Candidatus Loosdrechtia sp.]|uniref:CheR family methyltransferase n=1 Tax=Candidatus Loosdrechtia sp. TaxID=3101272 RepID=UPI003A6F5153|nr:MAG: CheR family methyltransferase [Candidatus Jettenia sp. AMX2]